MAKERNIVFHHIYGYITLSLTDFKMNVNVFRIKLQMIIDF